MAEVSQPEPDTPSVPPDAPAIPARHSSPLALVARALPWAVVAAALLGALAWTGTPEPEILRYTVYWIAGVVVPGTLVFRALSGSRGNLPEDIGFGAVTGFAVQLIGWALCVGTGLGGWLRLWPVLVIAPFVLVPGLRRHWSPRSADPMRLAASWAIAAVMLLAVTTLTLTSWGANPLPPQAHALFGDIYYHWANAAELRRTITPQQPQQAGDALIYHWFSDAYRGSASMLAGVPLSSVMLRLWIGPIALTTTLTVAALARHVSKVWWSGPVAALIAVAVPVASFWPAYVGRPATVLPTYSPTLVFSIPVLTAVVFLLVDVARGVPLGRGWILFAVLLPLATASKSSSLPVLFGGICLATAAAWVLHRRPPWPLLASIAAALVTLAVTRPALAGGEAGASVQLGAFFTFKPDFGWLTRQKFIPGEGGLLPAPWWHLSWPTRSALFALILCWLLSQLGRIAGLTALLHRTTRRDPAAWLLGGIGLAGWGGALLVNHVANGEAYFLYSAVPALAALTAWLLTAVAPGRRRVLVVLGGIAAGWLTGALLQHAGPGGDHLAGKQPSANAPGGSRAQWAAHWSYDLLAPVLALSAVLLAGVLLWWLLRRPAALAGAGAAALIAAAIGLGGDATYQNLEGSVRYALDHEFPLRGSPGAAWVSSDEMTAAAWLAGHAPTEDIVATNVHCEGVRTPTDEPCVNRSFWVSALTEHAVVIEGWAYQPATMAAHGVAGQPYFRQPAPDAERLRVNDAAFAAPTAPGLAALRDGYHAKWLYADSRASPVSPLLGTLATERYRAGTVTVYQLR